MAKKKKDKETTLQNYYDLKTKEMDELVAALKGETDESNAEPITTNIAEITGEAPTAPPESKKANFDPYRRDFLSRIPVWVKALFIKFWFFGVVCYFIILGLGNVIPNALDQAVLAGIVLGVVTDLFVNPIFMYLETSDKEYNPYMMFPFPFKKYWTFLTNIIYYLGVGLLVMLVYGGINMLFAKYEGYITLGVEPLLYGVFALVIDMAFIGVKDLIVFLVKRIKAKKSGARLEKGEESVVKDGAQEGETPRQSESAENGKAGKAKNNGKGAKK